MMVKNLAVGYTAAKQGRSDFENVKPDEHIMKICQLIMVCRTEEDSRESTFVVEVGQEIQFIEKLNDWIPKEVVEAVISESDALSLIGYFPTETREDKEQKEVAKEALVQLLTDPKVLNDLNYLAMALFGKELETIDDNNIGHYLNHLHRHQKSQDKIVEALFEYMNAMASAGTAI